MRGCWNLYRFLVLPALQTLLQFLGVAALAVLSARALRADIGWVLSLIPLGGVLLGVGLGPNIIGRNLNWIVFIPVRRSALLLTLLSVNLTVIGTAALLSALETGFLWAIFAGELAELAGPTGALVSAGPGKEAIGNALSKVLEWSNPTTWVMLFAGIAMVMALGLAVGTPRSFLGPPSAWSLRGIPLARRIRYGQFWLQVGAILVSLLFLWAAAHPHWSIPPLFSSTVILCATWGFPMYYAARILHLPSFLRRVWMAGIFVFVGLQMGFVVSVARTSAKEGGLSARVEALDFLGPLAPEIPDETYVRMLEGKTERLELQISLEALRNVLRVPQQGFRSGERGFFFRRILEARSEEQSELAPLLKIFDPRSLSGSDLKLYLEKFGSIQGQRQLRALPYEVWEVPVEAAGVLEGLQSTQAFLREVALIRVRLLSHSDLRYSEVLGGVKRLAVQSGFEPGERDLAAHTLNILMGRNMERALWRARAQWMSGLLNQELPPDGVTESSDEQRGPASAEPGMENPTQRVCTEVPYSSFKVFEVDVQSDYLASCLWLREFELLKVKRRIPAASREGIAGFPSDFSRFTPEQIGWVRDVLFPLDRRGRL